MEAAAAASRAARVPGASVARRTALRTAGESWDRGSWVWVPSGKRIGRAGWAVGEEDWVMVAGDDDAVVVGAVVSMMAVAVVEEAVAAADDRRPGAYDTPCLPCHTSSPDALSPCQAGPVASGPPFALPRASAWLASRTPFRVVDVRGIRIPIAVSGVRSLDRFPIGYAGQLVAAEVVG